MLTTPLALTSAAFVPNRSAKRVSSRQMSTSRPIAAAARRASALVRGVFAGETRCGVHIGATRASALACTAFAAPSSGARFSPRARTASVSFARRGLAAVALPSQRRDGDGANKTVFAAVGNGATDVSFADLDLCPDLLRALTEVKGFERSTAVQGQTLPFILGGADVLARAKTGSGKTIAFLLPALEKLNAGQIDQRGDKISVLILSPTRELATQILDETNVLLTFMKNVGAQVVYGGTNVKADARNLRDKRCDVLVATPGRLIDHLENGDMARRLEGCHTLVLDEADRLLDMGFKPSVEKILKYVPTKGRQTLLFSATVSKDIQDVARASLRPGHQFVDCVGEEASGTTNTQVTQAMIIAPLEDHFAQLKRVIDAHVLENNGKHKIMVFWTTARGTALAAELFGNMRNDVIEIHSKLSQSRRTKATDQFRTVKSGIMMTSDVTARGVDFDDVTLVVQMGVPSNREQYIHRLGRTGRAGKTGQGLLVLTPQESFFAQKDINDLPVKLLKDGIDDQLVTDVNTAMSLVKEKTKAQTYSAWLGFYKPFARKMNLTPAELVRMANFLAVDVLGCPEVPGLLRKTVGMMGLKDVPGLNIVNVLPEYGNSSGSSSGQGRPVSRPKDRDPRSAGAPGGRGGRRGAGGGRGDARGDYGGGRGARVGRGEPRGEYGSYGGMGEGRAGRGGGRGERARGYASESSGESRGEYRPAGRGGGRGAGRGEGGRGRGTGRGAGQGREQRDRDFQGSEAGYGRY